MGVAILVLLRGNHWLDAETEQVFVDPVCAIPFVAADGHRPTVGFVMKTSRGNSVNSQTANTLMTLPIGDLTDRIRPCDWNKCKTLFVSAFFKTTYEERFQTERRGQDSNLRGSFPPTDLANRRFRPLSHLSNGLGTRLDRVPDPFSVFYPLLRQPQVTWPAASSGTGTSHVVLALAGLPHCITA
jgi:hypothetical protein